ncbi:Sec-independent protein translocase subunit TatA/TatB [Halohasta salina]|uniref:Sec-independent protein translocase subunit TatA/TatB n=1 Tax=Halohasta salina TaxID=2961621 RepID=UPI0020A5C11E|nr:twin-arginine translocase TatA/TatE family subunit [Halohasta salina]
MVNVLPLFGPVGPEMLIILLVLVLLFGANKIPKLARSTGQAMGEFKKGREEIEDELSEMTDPDATPSETASEPSEEVDDTETETEKAS